MLEGGDGLPLRASRRSKRAPNAYVRGEATDCFLTQTSLAANPDYNNIRDMV